MYYFIISEIEINVWKLLKIGTIKTVALITCPTHMAARQLNSLMIIDALNFSNFK